MMDRIRKALSILLNLLPSLVLFWIGMRLGDAVLAPVLEPACRNLLQEMSFRPREMQHHAIRVLDVSSITEDIPESQAFPSSRVKQIAESLLKLDPPPSVIAFDFDWGPHESQLEGDSIEKGQVEGGTDTHGQNARTDRDSTKAERKEASVPPPSSLSWSLEHYLSLALLAGVQSSKQAKEGAESFQIIVGTSSPSAPTNFAGFNMSDDRAAIFSRMFASLHVYAQGFSAPLWLEAKGSRSRLRTLGYSVARALDPRLTDVNLDWRLVMRLDLEFGSELTDVDSAPHYVNYDFVRQSEDLVWKCIPEREGVKIDRPGTSGQVPARYAVIVGTMRRESIDDFFEYNSNAFHFKGANLPHHDQVQPRVLQHASLADTLLGNALEVMPHSASLFLEFTLSLLLVFCNRAYTKWIFKPWASRGWWHNTVLVFAHAPLMTCAVGLVAMACVGFGTIQRFWLMLLTGSILFGLILAYWFTKQLWINGPKHAEDLQKEEAQLLHTCGSYQAGMAALRIGQVVTVAFIAIFLAKFQGIFWIGSLGVMAFALLEGYLDPVAERVGHAVKDWFSNGRSKVSAH